MDLVTFGEGLIRLTPRRHPAPDGSRGFDSFVGGSELNVAVAAARLGASSRWVTRLPDNSLGRFIEGVARTHGVDARVDWRPEGRVGLYFLDPGAAPREPSVLYDRAGSAFSFVQPGQIPWPTMFDGARWFHLSGITPALSGGAARVAAESLAEAKRAGLTVSYDVNYRVKLWDPETARATQEPLLACVDVLVVSEDDTRNVFAVRDVTTAALPHALATRYGVPTVVVTARANSEGLGALILSEGVVHSAPRERVEVLERAGTGDAFVGALITARLEGRGWDEAARFAVAAASLKLRTTGDLFLGSRADVEAIVQRSRALSLS